MIPPQSMVSMMRELQLVAARTPFGRLKNEIIIESAP